MPAAIKVKNLSKAYQLGQIGTGTLQSDFKRWYAKARGKEDPFLKIGETNDRTVKGTSDIIWSLKDINFEIEQGNAVGIIGRNGAGKSTLLKILSRVTAPTTGIITGNGRIASLLEVGTGFHPELTGKENIYLNGAILGMRKKEIKRKFDAIVDFAGVDRYIDTPVKRYSSGMYVRLAFAVAAYLESEILIVDEVLAVGDAEFQKKCLGKMNDVSKGEGRTVLFVSHNMGAVQQLCSECIYLKNGFISLTGPTKLVIGKYLLSDNNQSSQWIRHDNYFDNEYFTIEKIATVDESLSEKAVFTNNKKIGVRIEGYVKKLNSSVVIGIAIYNQDGHLLFWSTNTDKNTSEWTSLKEKYNKLVMWIPQHFLNEGSYRIECIVAIHFREWIIEPEKNSPIIYFNIEGGLSESPNWLTSRPGLLAPIINYEKLED